MKDINKDIENLEEIINLINKELDKKDKNVSAILDLKDLLSLRNLIKAYKELEEENKRKSIEIICYQEELENSIPVSLVEEKIEELKEEIEQLRIESNITYDSGIYRNQIKIDILQELLERRK